MSQSDKLHPCQKCGACCASFRVSFYWREAESKEQNNAVPQGHWVDTTSQLRSMKGTDVKHSPKCVALKGRIGHFVNCEIYENRPSPCRRFKASYEDGQNVPRCDEAREKHGLRPLCKQDWDNTSIKPESITDSEI